MLYNNLTTSELISHSLNDMSDNALVTCLANRLEKSEVDEAAFGDLNDEISSLEEVAEKNDHKVSGYDETMEVILEVIRDHISGLPYDQLGGLLDQTDNVIGFLEDTLKEKDDLLTTNIRLEDKIEELEQQNKSLLDNVYDN